MGLAQIGEWYAVYDENTGCLGTVNSNYVMLEEEVSAEVRQARTIPKNPGR